MINCCQSLNGLENINADSVVSEVLIVDNINVETELASLQTQIDNVNIAVNGGGGFFTITCEYNGNWTQGEYFSWGGGATTNAPVLCNNQTLVGYSAATSTGTSVTSNTNIQITKNGTQVALMTIANGGTSTVVTTGLSVSFVLGDFVRVRFPNSAGQGSGGGSFRVSLLFATAAVNGQNVSFLTPNFTSLQPNQTAFLTDTITTANNTQTHQLAFGIPRGKSISAVLGSVSSGSAAVSTTTTTDGNGNDTITFNFVLQSGADGAQGAKGDKGNKGDDGNADPVVLVVAASAGGSAGAAAGGSAGAISGASAGASAGSSAATTTFNTLVDPRLQNVENKTYNIETPVNVLAGKTTIGGNTLELFPSGTLYLGGQVFGSGNTTDNINMLCNGGMIVDSGSTQFTNVVNMLNNLDVAGDLDVGGEVNIIENLTCLSDITLNTFLTFNNGSAFDSATIQVIPSVNPNQNNTGTMTINSQFLNIQSELILLQDDLTNPPDYPFIKFDANNFIGNNLYGSITCDTTTAPAVNNGGDFTFACNKLTTSNDLTVSGDLEVVGNFNVNNLTLNNLTINNTLKISNIKPLDNNVVIEIGNATTELNVLGASIELGVDTQTNVIGLLADSLSLGENASCGIIDIGYDGLTETTIKGLNLGVNAEIINIGQAGTSTLVSVRGEEIDIGDTDTNLIKIGRYNDYVSPIVVRIGNDTGETEIYGNPIKLTGQDVIIGDPTTTGDTLDIVSQTINIGQTPPNTATTNIDTRHINIGTNGSGANPIDITIGSDTSTTDIYGDIITIGDPNSQNSTQILSDICNILTNGTSLRTNALDMGSNYTTTANLTGQSITILGTQQTTLRGDTINIGNDSSTDTIQIGNSLSYTEIEGSQINMGVGSVLNTVNIGNAFSVVNIQGNQNNAINVANMFFNQIGF